MTHARTLPPAAAAGRARWRAAGWDYLGIVGWLAVVTAAGAAVRVTTGAGAAPPTLLQTDVVAVVLVVLPVWLHLTAAESGPAAAAWGKRRAGLRVVGPTGGRPGRGRAALRNAVKLLPWQLAHVAVARLALGVHQPVTIAVTDALALLLPAVSLVLAALDPSHRALHDRAAGTRVVPAAAD